MADIDLMRHWGRRDYVDEEGSGDSDSEFGKGPLFTIQEDEESDDCGSDYESSSEEEEEEEPVVDSLKDTSDDNDEDVYDDEYGNEDLEDVTDVNIKNLCDSDTETTLHDASTAANSTATNPQSSPANLVNQSLLQTSQPSHRMGSHNYIPAAATSSNANGKYRTVSVFGGILDLAEDGGGDGDSFSSDGFSDDDWSVEEQAAPKRKPVARKAATAAVNQSRQQQPPQAPAAVSPSNQEDVKVEKTPLKPQMSADEYEVAGDDASTESNDADTAVGTIITCSTADIPKSIDLSKFIDKPVKEQQGLLQSFLNELCFLRLPEEAEQSEHA